MPPRPSLRAQAAGAVVLATVASIAASSCSGGRVTDSSARLFAVHNAMRAMGLQDLGAVRQGVLAEGQEVRLTETLGAGCVTFVAFGGGGARDIALSLLDPDGNTIARDDTEDAQATLHTCVDRPGPHALVVRMASGSGDYLVSRWSGGDRARSIDAGSGPEITKGGSCDAPTPIVVGQTYLGDTEDGRADNEGSCGNSAGSEVVYRLDLAARQRVKLDVSGPFDTLLYVRKGDCEDPEAEVACNDDAPGGSRRSKIDTVLDAGTYFVLVDGYGDETGSFRLRVASEPVPSLADICRDAPPLAGGARLSARMDDAFDNVHASCGRGATGADRTFRLELPARMRVRVTEKSSEFQPVVHLRSACDDDARELACSGGDDTASVASVLDPGTYFLFADSADGTTAGQLTIEAETAPEAGGGAPGDACGDALPLEVASSAHLEGDTFAARDDFTSSCGEAGAPDVVYRLDVPHRSQLEARVTGDAGDFVLALRRSCADRATEVGCSPRIDAPLPPGTYFLVVDGKKRDTLGKFSLTWKLRDLEVLERTCAKAPLLPLGRPVVGTTDGAGDKYTSTCARPDGPADDRVYRFTLQKPTHLRIRVTPSGRGFSPVVSLRRDCTSAELSCRAGLGGSSPQVEAVLDPGAYFVVVDGMSAGQEGSFSLQADVVR